MMCNNTVPEIDILTNNVALLYVFVWIGINVMENADAVEGLGVVPSTAGETGDDDLEDANG